MVVIDTNVVIHGRGNLNFNSIIASSGVIEEIRSRKGKNILNSLDYEVDEPSENSLDKVKTISSKINSPTSKVDEEIIALALDRDEKIITDDKALQNLALHLNIDFEGFLDKPIQEKFKWETLCSNCGEENSSFPCSNCGSSNLRRRQVHYS